eukprot:2687250-Rhodomonas_salina.1
MPSPVLAWRVSYKPTRMRIPSTDVAVWCYAGARASSTKVRCTCYGVLKRSGMGAVCSTELAYGATRCARAVLSWRIGVLSWRMGVPVRVCSYTVCRTELAYAGTEIAYGGTEMAYGGAQMAYGGGTELAYGGTEIAYGGTSALMPSVARHSMSRARS